MDKRHLVFVEVRTRTSEDFMTPEASIRLEKRRVVRRTVRRLIRKHKTAGRVPRIDVVAIIWPAGAKAPQEVRHHEGAIALGER
jgi:Holliday junction resolvase-like predicted endonuclease